MTTINLRNLKRLDAGIEEIIQSVCHVFLFHFSTQSRSWQRNKIEGPLHVYRKGTTYGFMILNRNDTDHHAEILSQAFDMELQGQCFLYKNDRNEIFCIWFYDVADAQKMYNKVNKLKSGPESACSRTRASNGVTASPSVVTHSHEHHHHLHHHHHYLRNHHSNQQPQVQQHQEQPSIMDLLIRGSQKRAFIDGNAVK